MMPGITAHVDPDRCSGCGQCMDHCPFEALDMVDGKARVVGECGGCMVCVTACPEQAIAPVQATAIEDERTIRDPWTGALAGPRRHRGW